MIFSCGYWKARLFTAVLFTVLGFEAGPQLQAETLRSQLETLARENGVRFEGLDRLGDDPPKSSGGDVVQRIKALLADYNFMIVGQNGKIERVTITSVKDITPKPKNSGVVKTQRMGVHHQVLATLSGPNDTEITASLLVDTGATTLVLPVSMILPLGFSRESLHDSYSQTAAGSIPVKTGVLKLVRVGDVSAENVTVSFISDQKLNGAHLLGMSFLNRFRFSLDDANDELMLMAK